MTKQNELTPGEEKILHEIQLEKICKALFTRHEQLVLREEMVKHATHIFCERFRYTYPEKILSNYEQLKSKGIEHVIYYEPNFFLIGEMKEIYEPDVPSPKEGLSFDTRAYTYKDYEDIRIILEEWHDHYDLRKALVIAEDHLFDVDKMPLGPDHEPCTPLEAAAYMTGGFTCISLEPFVSGKLAGTALSINDKMKFYRKLSIVN
jgi:hypothetical protein